MPSPFNKKRWGDMDNTTSIHRSPASINNNTNDDSFFSVDSAGVVNIMKISSASFDYIGQYMEVSYQGDTATENDDSTNTQARGVNSDVAVASTGRDRRRRLSLSSSSSEKDANNSSNTSLFDGCTPHNTTCIGVSGMIDSALTGFADAIFDSMGMGCGFNFDSSCNNWVNVPPGGVRDI